MSLSFPRSSASYSDLDSEAVLSQSIMVTDRNLGYSHGLGLIGQLLHCTVYAQPSPAALNLLVACAEFKGCPSIQFLSNGHPRVCMRGPAVLFVRRSSFSSNAVRGGHRTEVNGDVGPKNYLFCVLLRRHRDLGANIFGAKQNIDKNKIFFNQVGSSKILPQFDELVPTNKYIIAF